MEHVAQIQRALAYMEENLKAQLGLDELARVAAFSPYHFHRVFQAVVGEPVIEYLRKRRLSEAGRELLADPAKRMIDVALEYQFTSQEAFIRSFRKAFGMTPGEFRRRGKAVPLRERAVADQVGRPVRSPKRPVLHRVHAAFLPVRSLERSIRWYEDRLGLQLMAHWGKGADFKVFNDETMLTLIETDRPVPAYYMDFRAHDLPQINTALRTAGVSVSDISGGEAIRTFHFTDPDGNRFDVWCQDGDGRGLTGPGLFDRLERVFLRVRNLSQAVDWYCTKLDMVLREHWGQGADLQVGTGQTLLTLIEEPNSAPRSLWDEGGEFPQFNFQTLSFDRTYRTLVRRRVRVTDPQDYGPVRCCHFWDLDGNLLGVCYEKPNSPFYHR